MGFCRTEERKALSREIRGVRANVLRVLIKSKKEHIRNIYETTVSIDSTRKRIQHHCLHKNQNITTKPILENANPKVQKSEFDKRSHQTLQTLLVLTGPNPQRGDGLNPSPTEPDVRAGHTYNHAVTAT